jgi:ABC-type dipeptide/oligopeptide/nickel transport system permease subunit
MWAMLFQADSLLRARPWAVEGGYTSRKLAQLGIMVAVFGITYGAVMGSFGGMLGEHFLQVVYSAVKVPFLWLIHCSALGRIFRAACGLYWPHRRA